MKSIALFFLLSLFFLSLASAQPQRQTVGLMLHDEARTFEGYTLFSPNLFTETYLIDNDGQMVHRWTHEHSAGGMGGYLLENGHLLRSEATPNSTFLEGGRAGRVVELDWAGNVVWEFTLSDDLAVLHHDLAPMPNGNVLAFAWTRYSFEEALAAGRDPSFMPDSSVWSERIIELQPDPATGTAEIVWEWDVWDHLIQDYNLLRDNFGDPAAHPELIDLNFGPTGIADWLHINSIDYHPDLDQIVINSPRFGEFWVIEHTPTTEEATGHTGGQYGRGGDLLYRWGNPAAYRAAPNDDKRLFFQHDVQWIRPGLEGEGNFLLFNNGNARPGDDYSSVEELTPPLLSDGTYDLTPGTAFGPEALVWEYVAADPADFNSAFISGAQRLPNGNTLICAGAQGNLFEVTSEGEMVWRYINPVTGDGPVNQGDTLTVGPSPLGLNNLVFRALRYAPDYAGLQGKDLTPMGTIEYPFGTDVEPVEGPMAFQLHPNYPNPFNPTTSLRFDLARPAAVTLAVYDVLGRRVATLADGKAYGPGTHTFRFDAAGLPSGLYLARLTANGHTETRTMTLAK